MGLSSKQVSSSGINWNQTLLQDQTLEIPKPPLIRKMQQQQNQPQPQPQQSSTSSSEPLKCPRCDSINTKFCYYNNYNKSQPRHFCRTCKRHWTKGGTLRNVPVGGGRKNKRVKKSTTNTSSAGGGAQNQTPLQRQSTLSLPPSSASLYQALIRPPPPAPSQSLNLMGNSGNGSFLSSSLPLVHQNQNFLFPFSSSSSFETNNPSCSVSISTSLRSSNAVYNSTSYGGGELKTTMEETTTTPVQHGQPWEIPSTSVGVGGNNLEMSSYWSWEDIDSLVSTDLNVPWDDSDLKP